MTDLDILRREMTAAGDRLLNALQLENEFTRLYSGFRRVEVLEQWREARRLVERTAEDYDRSANGYLEAVQASGRRPDLAYPPTKVVANSETTPG
jgi:hypothetical protein